MPQDITGVHVSTIGHSTRTLAELVEMLQRRGVTALADIRTVPRSRHNPQFNQEAMAEALRPFGMKYVHLAGLGGLRRPRTDSPNAGWKNASFRGFADYMLTDEFDEALAELVRLAGEETVAIMCAEAVPWRCHRSLVADALVARGARVTHLLSGDRAQDHRMTPFAVVRGGRVTYPGP